MNLNKVFLFRQNKHSKGAKILAGALGIKMIKPEGSRFTPGSDKAIINWGSGSPFPFDTGGTTVINKPIDVAKATNKLDFFQRCHEDGRVQIPEFTTRKMEAQAWLEEGHTLFARTILRGSAGAGIVDVSDQGTLDHIHDGTLLVKYIKKKHEFRIHVGDGVVIDRQQKKKRNEIDLEDINWRIRSHDNGFVFCRNNVDIPQQVETQAIEAMRVSGLDFGAVDVIWNKVRHKAYVLEINTAPGLEGSTVLSYRSYFASKLGFDVEEMDTHDVRQMAADRGIQIEQFLHHLGTEDDLG